MMLEATSYSMKEAPRAWAYDCSKKTIIAAQLLSIDIKAAADYAKKVYRHDARGMYKKIMSDAKKCLLACEKAGISLNNPLVNIEGNLYGSHGNGIAPYAKANGYDTSRT